MVGSSYVKRRRLIYTPNIFTILSSRLFLIYLFSPSLRQPLLLPSFSFFPSLSIHALYICTSACLPSPFLLLLDSCTRPCSCNLVLLFPLVVPFSNSSILLFFDPSPSCPRLTSSSLFLLPLLRLLLPIFPSRHPSPSLFFQFPHLFPYII